MTSKYRQDSEICAVFLSGQADHSGGCQMRAGPGLAASRPAWRLFLAAMCLLLSCRAAFLGGLSRNRIFCFERLSAAFTKILSKVQNINHIPLNYRSPTIAIFHLSTRPRFMQADAGFINRVQAVQGCPQRRLSKWRQLKSRAAGQAT